MTSDAADVLIVGGGFAGLAAAHALVLVGRRAIVLEASAAVGGRVRQCLLDEAGTLAEAGGEFFHGGTSTSKKWADTIGLPTERVFTAAHGDGGPDDEPAPDGSIAYYFTEDGERFSFDSSDAGFEKLNAALDRLRDVLSVAGVPESDTRSLRQYLHDEDVPARFLALAAASYSNTLGVGDDLDSLPLRSVARLERLWGADGEGDFRVATRSSGRQLCLAACCDALAFGTRVMTGWPVASVEIDGKRCCATATDGRKVYGAGVIIAAPVTLLQRGAIRFEPPLPSEKQSAIASIRMANAIKLIVLLREPPWDEEQSPPRLHSVISAGAPGTVVPEIWFKRTLRGGWVASGFATGSYADALVARGEAAAVDVMLHQLARTLPSVTFEALTSRLVAARLVDWASQGYVGGGYSAPSFLECDGHRALYRRPECGGLLGFCGEATEDACMTLSAALESGRRAASEMLPVLPHATVRHNAALSSHGGRIPHRHPHPSSRL